MLRFKALPKRWISVTAPVLVWIKRTMLERSRRSLLLMDSSRFNLHQFELVAPLGMIHDVVSDRPPDKTLRDALAAGGVAFHDATSSSAMGLAPARPTVAT